ncbi:ABC transporter permease [Labrys wisconsinensis]|uniref:Ribose transport system permease protein n=1 Tax=Labrys wisconsinensis TaxID=425677 RepID=A0ABU0JCS5_9HYPH|nr:ABC transporter permease [Labrys wisconsinensis]MDQ0470942.1 ribose transport system permease protein [Labrys wisconsinensis]
MIFLSAILPAQRNSRAGPWYLVLGFLVVVVAVVSLSAPLFVTAGNLSNVAAQVAPLLISAVGQTFVIIAGGLDLSVGALISLTTGLLVLDLPSWAVVLLVLAVAAAVGAVNGIGVAWLNVHPIIMTLASMSMVQGAALLVRPVPGGTPPAWVSLAVADDILGVHAAILWIVAFSGLAAVLLYRTRFGLHLFALGGDQASAGLNGVPVRRDIVLAYMLSSLFAAGAGVFLAGRIASGDANVGTVFGIDSITAVALGGTSLSGGVGSLVGTMLGAVIVGVIGNGMNLMNVSAFLQTVIKGALLLAVVCIQRRRTIGL